MQILNLELKEKSYNIYLQHGLLQNVGRLISEWYQGKSIAIVTDANVDRLHSHKLIEALQQYDYKVDMIVVAPGEQSKSMHTLDFVYSKLSEQGITRSSLIIAFGGGVIGDLAGFAAATFLRGVPYVQIPTTVMSQLDSSIGGKTAVNIAAGKNLAGCFYQPKAVYIDTQLLETLPDKFFADGIAEAVKYGCIMDADLFDKLRGLESLADARDNIFEIIYRCAAIKCKVVSSDEFDKGERMLLNFGHTIGHGIERYHNYEKYTHGEAVGLGMMIITKNAEALDMTEAGTSQAIKEVLAKFNLPAAYDSLDIDKLMNFISVDKKSAETYINLILLKEIGSAFIHRIPKNELISFIKQV